MSDQQYDFSNPYELARFVKDSTKVTPVKLYVKGDLDKDAVKDLESYGAEGSYVIFCEYDQAVAFLNDNSTKIDYHRIENDRRNSAIPLLDLTEVQSRIEPGSFIREGAIIGKNAVIMMGAVINLGAVVGDETMIDMGAVLGARATVRKTLTYWCRGRIGRCIGAAEQHTSDRRRRCIDRSKCSCFGRCSYRKGRSSGGGKCCYRRCSA